MISAHKNGMKYVKLSAESRKVYSWAFDQDILIIRNGI